MLDWQSTYDGGPLMTTVLPNPAAIPDVNPETKLCLESLLPLDLIRVHTKTDDVPSNTDEQLLLYRSAAIEAAEQYTGFVLGGTKSITEEVNLLLNYRAFSKGYLIYITKYPVMDGLVYYYGYGNTKLITIPPRTRKVRVPIMGATLDLSSSCCRGPCDEVQDNAMYSNMHVLYTTGFANCNDVPTGIVLGCLKYIAWCITHPGDELTSVKNQLVMSKGMLNGTNNAAWASGAIEIWRQYDPEAL